MTYEKLALVGRKSAARIAHPWSLAISVGQVVRQPTLTLPAHEKIGPCVTYSYCWLMSACESCTPSGIPVSMMSYSNPRRLPKVFSLPLVLVMAAAPLASQNQTEQQYISSVNTAINNLV